MTGNDIRSAFLAFFESRGHKILPSSSLVPEDPTTLFTTAGMQQFVPWFRREVMPFYDRVVTVQKCARTDDLDEVGRTARHHTFFEMLGNFSFGDYFKRETLAWGLDFSLTPQNEGGLGMNKDNLWVTYYKPKDGEPYEEDVETFNIWLELGMPRERIIPLGKKENWWGPVGDSGPCGPCSEMHYDRGMEYACGENCNDPSCGCDRWVEYWNHVFQQFNYEDGQYNSLPVKGIDTGAGLERIASLVGNLCSNFETDLIHPLIDKIIELLGDEFNDEESNKLALRVIADHLRCSCFMISDGVLPSNTKRGYVVRRIIRRAYRFGRKIGFNSPFLYKLVPTVVSIMGEHYTSLREHESFITDTLKAEEERFNITLDRGEELLGRLINETVAKKEKILDGESVFVLYDTYGFPKELSEETAVENGLSIDFNKYNEAFELAREKARSNNNFTYNASSRIDTDIPSTEFLGYNGVETVKTKVLAIEKSNDEYSGIVLQKTPFYATSGGQLADRGTIISGGNVYEVLDVGKDNMGRFFHTIEGGNELNDGDEVIVSIDINRRKGVMRAHTATHLLHRALKEIIGENANQAGSQVDDDLLRFDFSSPRGLTEEEIISVMKNVYKQIMDAIPVCNREMELNEAKEAGFTALFGEKYGDTVRTVAIGESLELCGGLHVKNSGEVGPFIIISEASIAGGIRRIEAICGMKAIERNLENSNMIAGMAGLFKSSRLDIPVRIAALREEIKFKQSVIDELKVKLASGTSGSEIEIEEISGVNIIVSKLDGVDAQTINTLLNQYMDKLSQNGIVILASVVESDKIIFAVKVGASLVGKYNAGQIVKVMAVLTGGNGGGKADYAQAGGKEPAKLDEAIEKAKEIIVSVGS